MDAAVYLLVLLAFLALTVFLTGSFRNDVETQGNDGVAKTSARTLVRAPHALTRADGDPFQYGHLSLGRTSRFGKRFGLDFDVLLEERQATEDSVHALVFLSLFGDPARENARSSEVKDDGGFRFFMLKIATYGTPVHLDAFESLAGIARNAETKSWDLVEKVPYLPTAQWIHVALDVDLEDRTIRSDIDDQTFEFKIPSWFSLDAMDPDRDLYLGAKTLKGTGVSVRNVVAIL
jgi:hypothetical protein